jgi:hypothetical protein
MSRQIAVCWFDVLVTWSTYMYVARYCMFYVAG